MKELWLMCKSSLYCNFIDQNEQRINNGEIDLMYFPSDMFAFNTSKLPLDLHDEEDINTCLEYAFGQRELLRDLFKELADLNVAHYDKIGLYIDRSANDMVFCEMMHYFVDADIHIKYCDRSYSFVASNDVRREIEENYDHISSENHVFLRESENGFVEYSEFDMVLSCLHALMDEDLTSASYICAKFKEKCDPTEDINPLFLAKLLAALAYDGAIKAYKDGELYTCKELTETSERTFLNQAKVRCLNQEEEREWLNEIEIRRKMMEVA